jgi:pimeloyl-ACP methyl ester carboxylesterase
MVFPYELFSGAKLTREKSRCVGSTDGQGRIKSGSSRLRSRWRASTGRVGAEEGVEERVAEGVAVTNRIEGDLQTDHGHFGLYRTSRTGRAGRLSVVLAHGLGDSAKCWWRVADALAEQYDVIAHDARHHGASSTVAGSSTGLVDDLAGIIDTAGPGRPMLIGHSVVSAPDCPTLLLHGDVGGGGIVADAVARRVGELNSLVTCQRIDGAGHNIHRENFVDAVAEFLRSI